MTTVFFSKNGTSLSETFNHPNVAIRWIKLIERNGYKLDNVLEH